MCGIGGVFNVSSQATAEAAALDRMCNILAHRGPDAHCVYGDGLLGFAHTRLKIIDLAGGGQPMVDRQSGVALAYNGEIWNYRELRQRLSARGHRFGSESDTEVVLRAYLDGGTAFLAELDGMFALAIWDPRTRRLLLARDRMGKKPLYYTRTAEGDVVFGSEIKALFCDRRVQPMLDCQALADFLALRYVPAPGTMFAGIAKLPPATLLEVTPRQMRQTFYWKLGEHQAELPRSDGELKGLVRDSIRAGVAARLIGDVPLGALLSGGVDSSIIVAEASGMLSSPLATFTARFVDAPPEFDESPYARCVAERYRTNHHVIDVGEEQMLGALPAVAWHRDEPISEPAEVPTYLVCKGAREHATVLLSGEGADELFAGYPKYAYDWLAQYTAAAPAWLRQGAGSVIARLPERYRRVSIAARALLEADEARRWCNWFGAFTDDEKLGLLASRVKDEAALLATGRVYAHCVANQGYEPTDALQRMLHMDMAVWLPDNLLMKGDKMSMAASVELRMPFLDRQLVELAMSIPSRRRIRPFVSKYLLKEAYAGVFPRKFLYRRKVGFQVPVGIWLRSDTFAFLRATITGEQARARALFDPGAVAALVHEHVSGRANHQTKLFTLLAIELWHRLHLDKQWSVPPTWDDILQPDEQRLVRRPVGTLA